LLSSIIALKVAKGGTPPYSIYWARSTALGCLQYMNTTRPQFENVRDALGRAIDSFTKDEHLVKYLSEGLDYRWSIITAELEKLLKAPHGTFRDEDIDTSSEIAQRYLVNRMQCGGFQAAKETAQVARTMHILAHE